MSKIRNEIAVLIYELKGQELIDALEKLAKDQFHDGYEAAMDAVSVPMDVGCEFD